MDRIGLIAGAGDFPSIFAKEAKAKNTKVIAFAIKGMTAESLSEIVDKIHWFDPARFNIAAFVMLLITERIKNMVMVGKVDKALIFNSTKGNKDVESLFKSSKDSTDYSILAEVTRRFNQIGINIIDGMDFLKDLIPGKGVLTARQPSPEEMADIEFGINMAREIAHMDIGQTITVKNKAVITVEAIEGTDNTIRRAYDFVKGDFTVIKMARPKQDMRWDVPLVGLDTIRTMAECRSHSIAIESGKMFLAEKEKTLEEADKNGITIIAV